MDMYSKLIYFSKRGNVIQVVKILDEGFDINARGPNGGVEGRAAIHYSVAGEHIELTKLLIKRFANVDIESKLQDDYGATPLQLAAETGNQEMVEIFLKAGADPEIMDDDKLRAVHVAAAHGRLETLKVLDRYKCDLFSRTGDQSTALHYAASKGSLDVVMWLVDKGLNPNIRKRGGKTAKDLAEKFGHKDIKLFLRSPFSPTGEKMSRSSLRRSFRNRKQSPPRDNDNQNRLVTPLHNSNNISPGSSRTSGQNSQNSTPASFRESLSSSSSAENSLRTGSATQVKTSGLRSTDLIEKLGEGAYGEVFLVKKHGKDFALKKINLQAMSLTTQEYAHQEIELLKLLSHPYIVAYMGGGVKGHYLHIQMEYCSGGTLHDLINKQKQKNTPFKEQQIVNWSLCLCLALKYIHGRRILHRDIKPENIFMTGDGVIKLGDFGVAKDMMGQSKASTCIGSPAYMSPELVQGTPYNAASDMWSFGCVMFELAALKRAFPYTRLVLPDSSQTYCEVVLSLLQEEPIKRPTAAELLKLQIFHNALENQLLEKEHRISELTQKMENFGRDSHQR